MVSLSAVPANRREPICGERPLLDHEERPTGHPEGRPLGIASNDPSGIRENNPPGARDTDSAVRSILRILINKGHLTRELDGPRYVYSPTTPAPRASRSAMRHVLSTFFGGSVEGAVATLLKLREGDLTPAERARIKAMIDEAAEEGR